MSNARKLADNLPSEGQLSNRNILINGKFEVDQRHGFASHTVSAGSDFFADRWGFYTDSNAIAQYGATTQVVSDGPTGFEKSLKWTTTSAGTVPATSEVLFRQKIEGYNINQVDYGTSNAKELTLSFYVKSSVAGNYGFTCWFNDSGGTNRYILRSYTINSANTWEYKTISIPANTANALGKKTNLDGMHLNWDLGEGATYSGNVTGNWQSTYVNGLTGGVKIANNNGATWQITGAQLEVGSQSTPFEHEKYGDTLNKCYRYFFRWKVDAAGGTYNFWNTGYAYSSNGVNIVGQLPVNMRASPTFNGGGSFRVCSDQCINVSGISLSRANTKTPSITPTGSGFTAGQAYALGDANDATCFLDFDAEL